MFKESIIEEVLENAKAEDVVRLWNAVCEENDELEPIISMDSDPWDVAEALEMVDYIMENGLDDNVQMKFDADKFKEAFIEDYSIGREDVLDRFINEYYTSLDAESWITLDWDDIYDEFQQFIEDENEDEE